MPSKNSILAVVLALIAIAPLIVLLLLVLKYLGYFRQGPRKETTHGNIKIAFQNNVVVKYQEEVRDILDNLGVLSVAIQRFNMKKEAFDTFLELLTDCAVASVKIANKKQGLPTQQNKDLNKESLLDVLRAADALDVYRSKDVRVFFKNLVKRSFLGKHVNEITLQNKDGDGKTLLDNTGEKIADYIYLGLLLELSEALNLDIDVEILEYRTLSLVNSKMNVRFLGFKFMSIEKSVFNLTAKDTALDENAWKALGWILREARITSLVVCNYKYAPDVVEKVAALRLCLKKLGLPGCDLSQGVGIDSLRNSGLSETLTSLDVSRCSLNEDHMSSLIGMKCLRELNIGYNLLASGSLRPLMDSDLVNTLEVIYASGNNLDEEEMGFVQWINDKTKKSISDLPLRTTPEEVEPGHRVPTENLRRCTLKFEDDQTLDCDIPMLGNLGIINGLLQGPSKGYSLQHGIRLPATKEVFEIVLELLDKKLQNTAQIDVPMMKEVLRAADILGMKPGIRPVFFTNLARRCLWCAHKWRETKFVDDKHEKIGCALNISTKIYLGLFAGVLKTIGLDVRVCGDTAFICTQADYSLEEIEHLSSAISVGGVTITPPAGVFLWYKGMSEAFLWFMNAMKIQSLDLSKCVLRDVDLEMISGLELEKLYVSYCNLDIGCTEILFSQDTPLRKCITSLDISGAKLSEIDLRRICGLQLVELDISSCGIRSGMLGCFGKPCVLKDNLKTLKVGSNRLIRSDFEAISQIGLTHIDLNHCDLQPGSLEPLLGNPFMQKSLSVLKIRNRHLFNENEILMISCLKGLVKLHLDCGDIPAGAIARILGGNKAFGTKLRELYFVNCEINQDDINAIAGLGISVLELSGRRLPLSGALPNISTFVSNGSRTMDALTTLHLNRFSINEEHLASISKLKKLEDLDIWCEVGLSMLASEDSSLRTKLKKIVIHSRIICRNSILAISKLPLVELNIFGSRYVSENGRAYFYVLKDGKCALKTSLKKLEISKMSLSDEDMMAISHIGLEKLVIDRCNLADESLVSLGREDSKIKYTLRELNVDTSEISAAEMDAISKIGLVKLDLKVNMSPDVLNVFSNLDFSTCACRNTLKMLTICNLQLSENDLRSICKLRLESLGLDNCGLTPGSLALLGESDSELKSTLRSLSLRQDMGMLSTEEMKALSKMSLWNLNISNYDLDHNDIEHLLGRDTQLRKTLTRFYSRNGSNLSETYRFIRENLPEVTHRYY